MILKLTLKNYRSYKEKVTFSMEPNSSDAKSNNIAKIFNDAEQEYKILKIAMIYGANASGKTNIIRALYEILYLILNKPTVGQSLRINDSFKLDDEATDSPSEFEITFLGPENIKYSYSFSVLGDTILSEELNYYPNGKITNVFTRNAHLPENTVQSGVLGDKFGKKKIAVFENQLILSKFGDDEPHEDLSKIFQYFEEINIINATNERHLESLQRTTSKTLSENEELLRKVNRLITWADTKIDRIQIVKQIFDDKRNIIREKKDNLIGPNPYDVYGIHKIYKNNNTIGEYVMEFKHWSHGTQSLYKLGGEIITSLEKGSTIIIDELDTSLHPFLTKLIVMLFQSTITNPKNAQLIFTTHDITLLDRDLIRRDQIWLAEKSEQGCSDLYSLQDFEEVREDTPFEKWYMAGKFGGLPQIKSVDGIFDKE
jgi:AAA15 family ATPase/GTPase